MIVDAHAHLTDRRFAGEIDEVVARAAAAGVGRILTCGEDLASSEAALALGQPLVRVAVGFHPHRAEAFDEVSLARLRDLAGHGRVVAIGEIGIDLSGRSAPLSAQERAFSAQLALAAELDLPVVVHVREAGDLARRLVDAGPKVRGQLHCYSEGLREVDGWLERGFLISFAGTVTYPGSVGLRAAARAVPADRLLAETDAPHLAPQAVRGQRNEPAFIAHTVAALARERGEDPTALGSRLAANAAALFGRRWGTFGGPPAS